MSAENYQGAATNPAEYIHESIQNPNLFLVPGYKPNVMPQDFAEKLTETEINDLVAYLLQFK